MPIGSLWLPVIVSAIVVFFASSIMHMALKYHRADIKSLPNEGAVRDAVAKSSPAPGVYFSPYCADHKQMNEPRIKEMFEKGPVMIITVLRNGPPVMMRHLSQWFAFAILVSFISAYVARHTLHPGDDGMNVMRITGTVAFTSYALSNMVDSIWKGQPWGNTWRSMIDGAVYALLTGLTFRLMWPGA